jgi:hypothetical protein
MYMVVLFVCNRGLNILLFHIIIGNESSACNIGCRR